LAVHADKYHVVEQGGEGGGGGNVSTGGGGASQCLGTMGCGSCTACAWNTDCATEWQNCLADGACVNFGNCLTGCYGTIECWNGCLTTYPSAGGVQDAWTTCAACKSCRNQCGLAVSCP
jgi:hypothetical protein